MTVAKLLLQKKEVLLKRWLDEAMAVYADDSSAAFKRQKDPFANPVGDSLRRGTRTILDALLTESEDESLHNGLEGIVKIRAVQDFPASRALEFIFRLKDVIRDELGSAATQPANAVDLLRLETRIDRIGLAAFDLYVACRQQLSELRINEIKRRVAWIAEKMNRSEAEESEPGESQPEA